MNELTIGELKGLKPKKNQRIKVLIYNGKGIFNTDEYMKNPTVTSNVFGVIGETIKIEKEDNRYYAIIEVNKNIDINTLYPYFHNFKVII